MTFGCALLVAVCTFVNWRLLRSVLCPPVIFSGLWAAILFGLVLSGNDFYTLGPTTLGLCLVSVVSFSVGCQLVPSLRRKVRRGPEPTRSSKERKYLLRTLDVLLALFVIALPLYWSQLNAIHQASVDSNFLRSVRTEMVLTDTGRGTNGFGLLRYVLSIPIVLTLIATVEAYRGRERKWRIVAWIVVSLAYFVPTGSRTTAVVLIIGVLCAVRLTSGRLRLRTALISTLAAASVFSFAAIALGKGGSRYADGWENVSSVAYSFRLYSLGGIVACDQLIRTDAAVSHGQIKSLRFFYALGKALGFDLEVPQAVELPVPTPGPTNVYSIYFYYFKDLGWVGMAAIFAALGALLSLLFSYALSGRPEAMVLSSLGCAFLVFTCSGDPFLNGMSSSIQAAAEVFLLYKVCRMCGAARRRPRRRYPVGSSSRAGFSPQGAWALPGALGKSQ
jgi:oligosaccharide repeat unit polymerase